MFRKFQAPGFSALALVALATGFSHAKRKKRSTNIGRRFDLSRMFQKPTSHSALH
jgi:hypothetical protein